VRRRHVDMRRRDIDVRSRYIDVESQRFGGCGRITVRRSISHDATYHTASTAIGIFLS
jgi:hypothetical protein